MEIHVQKTSSHPNVVQFVSAHKHAGFIWVALEYMGGGTLTDLIDSRIRFRECHVAYVLREILNALKFLHGMHRIHRDIKSDNILLSTRGDIKIGMNRFCFFC